MRLQSNTGGRILLTLLTLLTLSACSGGIETWVKPYERDRLADPIMALDGDPASDSYIQHVHETHEAARGGEGSVGGGCGCY